MRKFNFKGYQRGAKVFFKDEAFDTIEPVKKITLNISDDDGEIHPRYKYKAKFPPYDYPLTFTEDGYHMSHFINGDRLVMESRWSHFWRMFLGTIKGFKY